LLKKVPTSFQFLHNCYGSITPASFPHQKPNSILFQAAIEKMKRSGIAPHEICYVGNDLYNDVYGAQQNGMRAALFIGDGDTLNLSSEREEVKNVVPDIVVEHVAELLMRIKA